MMKKKGWKIAVLVLFILLLSGCWNNRPLKTIGINAAIGIDRVQDNKIEFSVQLVKPAALAAEPPKNEKAYIFASNISDTLHSAGRNLFTYYLNKTVYIDHVQLIVIGEDMARDGIADAIDFWERDHEANVNSLIVVSKDIPAKTVLQAESEMEEIPTQQIVKSIKLTVLTAEAYESSLFDVISSLNAEGIELVTGIIQFKPGSDYKSLSDIDLRGACVFKGDRLVGWLGPNDIKSLMIIQNNTKGGLFEIVNPYVQNEVFNYEMLKAATKTKVTIQDGQPKIKLNIEISGGLSELHGEAPDFTSSNFKVLEDATAEGIKSIVENTIDLCQHDFESDIFGFGLMLARKYPDYWEQNKDDWDQIYPSLSIEVEVKVTIKEFGRIYESNLK